jgi:hypothetical protein
MRGNFNNIKDLYSQLKADKEQEISLWEKISKVVGIQVKPRFETQLFKGETKDELIDDPTAAISVNQAGDYLQGITWGTGENAFQLDPSDHVLDYVDRTEVSKFFKWVSARLLSQMNHSEAGLNSAQKAYNYDQVAFGTSGIGAFPNKSFRDGVEDNLFIFRDYGVDNLVIDEGKNGKIDTIFVSYRWKINRIVNEFAKIDGVLDPVAFAKLPREFQQAYNGNSANLDFVIVQGIVPRHDYNPRMKGKRGARYRGIWFYESDSNESFAEEDYKVLPIAVCRAIKLRGEKWGRSSGTLLISTIMSVNYMVGKTIEILEKMASPALAAYNDALFGDKVIDTSSDGMVMLNSAMAEGGKQPLFPLYDVGDPSRILQFLVPYLNEKIATAFKIDILLDFSEQSSKTATEMLQRAVIRGKSLSGTLQQQKSEYLEPLITRCAVMGMDHGILGVNAELHGERAAELINANKAEQIIPEAVVRCIQSGKPWFKIKFNNELEKLSRTERLDGLMQMLNVITAMMAVFPSISAGIKWHELLLDFKDALNIQGDFLLSAKEFQGAIERQSQMQAQAMALEAGRAGSEIAKNSSGATKNNAEANAIKERGR